MGDSLVVKISTVRDILNSFLEEAYYCTRVWSAWSYGTMTQEDFENIDIEEIIQAIIGEDEY